MIPLWSRLRTVLDAHPRAALVGVVATAGSVPREAGARMIVLPDGGFLGTVGGGALEWELIAEARAMLEGSGPARLRVHPLGPELGQCCGGRVTTLIEIFGPEDHAHVAELAAAEDAGFACEAPLPAAGRRLERVIARGVSTNPHGVIPGGGADPGRRLAMPEELGPGSPLRSGRDDTREGGRDDAGREGGVLLLPDRLVETFRDARTPLALFGAGHVGRALVLALAPLPFRIRWIDSRPEAFPALVPDNATPVRTPDPAAEIAGLPPGGFVLVMTHSHPLDLAVTAAALARDDLAFVGLIGSATKRARFERRMRDLGLTPAALRRLVCPIGIAGVTGKEPAVIAAGVAAQLLVERERRAAAARTGERRARA